VSADPTPSSPENAEDAPADHDSLVEEDALTSEGAPSPDEAADADGPAVLEVPHDLGAVLDSVVAERDELTTHLAEQRDSYARLAADFDNYKKRTARTQRDEVARAAGSIIDGLLPVLDGCDAAVQQGVDGVQPIAELLLGALVREGLSRLDPLGDVFDPALHQAVVNEPAAEDADGGITVVTEVMRPGYLWRDQVLRPAMVKVQDQ
jgi:molecular chaperone GrpE